MRKHNELKIKQNSVRNAFVDRDAYNAHLLKKYLHTIRISNSEYVQMYLGNTDINATECKEKIFTL